MDLHSLMNMHVVYYILATALVLIGLVGTILPVLPGLPLMFAGMLLGAWADNFNAVGPVTLSILGMLTLISLVVDFWATAMGAKRVGASKLAIIGASAGTLLAFILGPWWLLIGPFAGAVIGELYHQRHFTQAAKVGIGTWIGLLVGVALKLALAFTMLAIFAFAWFI